MNPIEAMARAYWDYFASHTTETFDAEDAMRAALIALRDHEDTPPAAVAWIVKMMMADAFIEALEKQP